MPWTSLRFSPGLVRSTTRYATSGTWFDASLVRFRDGLPERWSGWTDAFPNLSMIGICRSLYRHSNLDGVPYTSAGTSKRFYMITQSDIHDVTPIGATNNLGANPFASSNGSTTITVTDTGGVRDLGDTVIFSGATTFAGIPAGDLNKEHPVTANIDDTHYTIEVATPANATTTGGGASVIANYLFVPGDEDVPVGGGWGALGWGEEEWGGDDASTGIADQLGVWSHFNWGEDMIANAKAGPIFYWDASNPGNRMIDILDLPGADGNAPQQAEFIIISHRDRHALAFGVTGFGGGFEPMTFRWSNQEDILNWNEADLAGTAGSLPLSHGSKFIAVIATSRETVVWTDQAMYSVQYIGPPLIYAADIIEKWSDILGSKSVCSYNGVVYWMGNGGFYMYHGRTEKMKCPVWDYVSNRLNREQAEKVCASSNQIHNEVIWFYPSNASGNSEVDSYVAFDIEENIWTFGMLARTAWLDGDAVNLPFAASPADGKIYEHEVGSDDGSTNPATPLNAYIESGPFELSSEGAYDKGDRFMFIRRILPDITFRQITTSSSSPQVKMVLKMMDKPGGGFSSNPVENSFSRTAEIPIEEFTEEAHVRLRGRAMIIRVESDTPGSQWRLGVPRIDVRPDGQR